MSKKVLSCAGIFCALFIAASVLAAENEGEGRTRFDSRIDTWAQGTIVKLDADAKKLTVRGWKMPYASEHAQMMQEIYSKTKGLNENERKAKVEEIRRSWQDKLAAARKDTRDTKDATDFTFNLPEGNLTVLDGQKFRTADWMTVDRGQVIKETGAKVGTEEAQPVTAGDRDNVKGEFDKEEARAMLNLKDLKIGDKVLVGFDSGVINNDVYTVIKTPNLGEKSTR